MFLYIMPLLYVLFNIKRRSISFYLFAVFGITIYLGILIGQVVEVNDTRDTLNVIYLTVVFFIIYHSFCNYRKVRYIEDIPNDKVIKKIINAVFFIGMLCFVINLYTSFKAFSNVFTNGILISDYKNGSDENGEFVNSLMNRSILSIIRILSPTSYLAMGIHFYYLHKHDIKRALLFFLPASNILLVSLWSLSRSSFVEFGFIYVFYLILLYPSFSDKVKKSIKKYLLIMGGVIVLLFGAMTTNRFAEMTVYDSNSKIDDPITYSLINYASQSHYFSVKLLHEYNDGRELQLKPSLALYHDMVDKLTGSHRHMQALDERDMKFGDFFACFTSGPSSMVYEFGYLGSFVFWLFIFYIVRMLSPHSGKISFVSLILYCPLIDLVSTCYMGNRLYLPMFHIGTLYVTLFVLFVTLKKSGKRNI